MATLSSQTRSEQTVGNNPTGIPGISVARKGSSEWKAQILKWLGENPGNLTACAKAFDIDREELEKFLDRNPKEAKNLKDEYLDELESLVYKAALGRAELPENFSITNAMRLLKEKRPKEWGGKVNKNDDDEAWHGPPVQDEEQVNAQWVTNQYGQFLERRPTEERADPTIIRVEDPPGRFMPANDSERFERVYPTELPPGNGLPGVDDSDI